MMDNSKLMHQIDQEKKKNTDRYSGPATIDNMCVEQIYDYLARSAQDVLHKGMTQLINSTAANSHSLLGLSNLPKTIASNYIFGSQLMIDAIAECCFDKDGSNANVIFAFEREFDKVNTAVDFAATLCQKKGTKQVYTWGELIWLRVMAESLNADVSDFHENLVVAFKNGHAMDLKADKEVDNSKWKVLLGSTEKQYAALAELFAQEK